MKCRRFTGLVLAVALTAATDGWAGSWATQATLANNAYQGSVSLDASGNMVSAWSKRGDRFAGHGNLGQQRGDWSTRGQRRWTSRAALGRRQPIPIYTEVRRGM